jgi:hypothetical protein
MNSAVFVNELRIPTGALSEVPLLQAQTSGISSRHKREVERQLGLEGWIAIFEGDVLFTVPRGDAVHANEANALAKRIPELGIRGASSTTVRQLKLGQAPRHLVERMTFAILRNRAEQRGIFALHGSTFFRPSDQVEKLSHRCLETTMLVAADHVKVFLTPGYVALVSIEDTYREKLPGLELIRLCRFRSRSACSAAYGNGACPIFQPGTLGYFDVWAPLAGLGDGDATIFRKRFDSCTHIAGTDRVVLAKATPRATKDVAFPGFAVFSRLAREDLAAYPQVLRQYRDATLMPSSKRWQETIRWLKDIFAISGTSLPPSTTLNVAGIAVPIEFVINNPVTASANHVDGYSAVMLPAQKVINDQNDPIGKPYGGGWLFSSQGAYDRASLERPFDSIKPYLVVPDLPGVADLSRRLTQMLSDGEYKARTPRGDQDFSGVNRPDSQRKYGVQFHDPWKTEEGVYLLRAADEASYRRQIQDVVREWGAGATKDPNRLVLVILPSASTEESPLYYALKKVLIEAGIPSQFIALDTLRSLEREDSAFGPTLHSLWLNIYAKMGGKPWSLAAELENVHCFVGIGFGLSTDVEPGKHIFAGFAHVFDRFGNWIDVAGDSVPVSRQDLDDFYTPQRYLEGTSSFKISRAVTQGVIYNVLKLYENRQTKTREAARNIVLHKLGPVYECEIVGFLEGVAQVLGTLEQTRLGIVQIEQDHQVKVYGAESKDARVSRVVPRGTALTMDSRMMALATTGSVERPGKPPSYHGIGTPQPLLLSTLVPSATVMQRYGLTGDNFYPIDSLARHIMALTQLHWGSTRDLIRLPITALYAQKVADLLSKTGANVDLWEALHRPWFL